MPATAQRSAAQATRHSDSLSSALEELLTRYSGLISHAARTRNLQDSDVDEVLQDVRIRIWRSLSTREKIALAPASYVYRTAISASLDLIRRRRADRVEHSERVSENQAVASGTGPDQTVEAAEFAALLAEALSRIRESRRLVVRMHMAGYHRCEIAEIMGWTEAKTRNLLYRGLADLRQQLETGSSHTRRGGQPGVFSEREKESPAMRAQTQAGQ
jgi:RNA polymerase sigma factor (sigma-70 family)